MAALDTYPLHEDLSAYLTFATARFKVIVGDRSRCALDQRLALLSFLYLVLAWRQAELESCKLLYSLPFPQFSPSMK